MPRKTRPYRETLLNELKDKETAVHYLNAHIGESTCDFLQAMRDVAEAQQMSQVASDAGVRRESLYRMLSAKGNPTYNSLTGILTALGLAFTIDLITNDYDERDDENTHREMANPATSLSSAEDTPEISSLETGFRLYQGGKSQTERISPLSASITPSEAVAVKRKPVAREEFVDVETTLIGAH